MTLDSPVLIINMAKQIENGTWRIGLVNSQNLYLSAEKFQFKVNASGKTMKMKQIWTFEKLDDEKFALKSWLDRYLGCNKNGVITADAEEVGKENVFTLVNQGNEKFEIKSELGHSLGGSLDQIAGKLRETKPEGWCIHLAILPQINLRNIQRKAFARLSSDGKQFEGKSEIPWGQECIVFLQYRNGKYCFQDINGQYLHRDGTLKSTCDDDSLFVLFFKQSSVAFRDVQGKFLSCVGPQAVLQSSKKDVIGQSDLFEINNARPQVSLMAFNQKYFSNKQGTDVRANQFDVENTEIFQMEAADPADRSGNVKWAFLGLNKCYWNIEGNSLACSSGNTAPETSQFEITWKADKVLLKCSNGKFLSAKSGGQLTPTGSSAEDEACQFTIQMVNRPLIVIKGCYGFIGVKGASGVLECNRSQPEVFKPISATGFAFAIQINGKYWDIGPDNTIVAKSDKPVSFCFELRAHNNACIVAPNGKYLRGAQNGAFTATGDQVEESTLWEI